MPIATINIIQGRSEEKIEALIQNMSKAIAESLDAPLESVRVIVNEVPKEHFGIGGKSAKKLGK
jgi:4-oxalocrotonate tautomerase